MKMTLSQHLESFTHLFAKWAGSADGFVTALVSMLLWLMAGGVYRFCQNWQNGLTIYIGTLTFLMVFLIQRSQNKELAILYVKLNELIVATKHANNQFINIEDLTEKEISAVQDMHHKIGEDA
jgi:low affinity Fe/Cu permease